MKVEQLQKGISKLSSPVSTDIITASKSVNLKADQRKVSPFWEYFGCSSKIYMISLKKGWISPQHNLKDAPKATATDEDPRCN